MLLDRYTHVGRLVTITDADHAAQDGPNFSAPCYCLASTAFWCTDEDLDDPDAPLFVCQHAGLRGPQYIVEFQYDGGRYYGELWLGPFSHGGDKICGYKIAFRVEDVSSK